MRILFLLALLAARPVIADPIDDGAAAAGHTLRSIVTRLARDQAGGRDNDTPASLAAQRYLIRRLRRIGQPIHAGVPGDAGYQQPFTFGDPLQHGTNLAAVIPGTDLANEYVMIGGHYDHLDTRSDASGHCRSRGTPGGAVCNGATDNAAGTAVTLAVGRAIARMKTPPRRSVLVVLWDAEEDGLQGSLHYVNHPLVPLAQTVAYLNFDVQGATLLPSVRNVSFSVGAETGGQALQDLVTTAVAGQAVDTRPVSYIFGQLRSDYANLVNAGVPTVFFSDSTGGCYHTTGDDVRVVSFPKLREQAGVGFRTAAPLIDGSITPTFVPPSASLATYADAQSVGYLLDLGVPQDLDYFLPADRPLALQTRAQIDQIVADGPVLFDNTDVGAVLGAAANMINALTRIPCQPF